MSLHSRPLPAPALPGHVVFENHPTHPGGVPPHDTEPPRHEEAAPSPRAEPRAPEAAPRPWYRSEPWLAAILTGFIPMVAAVFLPESAKYPLVGLGVLAVVVGIAMLIRQGPFDSHRGPEVQEQPIGDAVPARTTSEQGRTNASDEAAPGPVVDRDPAERVP